MKSEVYVAHDIEFHKYHFGTTHNLYLYRKRFIKITQMIWIKKQPFVNDLGITESSAVILHHLN